MKSLCLGVLLGSMALWLGCAPIAVKTDYDRTIDFTNYQTFKWMPYPKKRGKNVVQKGSFEDVRIRRAVESELLAKGYQVKKSGRADALLAYHVAPCGSKSASTATATATVTGAATRTYDVTRKARLSSTSWIRK